jgi:hypothetical protein
VRRLLVRKLLDRRLDGGRIVGRVVARYGACHRPEDERDDEEHNRAYGEDEFYR